VAIGGAVQCGHVWRRSRWHGGLDSLCRERERTSCGRVPSRTHLDDAVLGRLGKTSWRLWHSGGGTRSSGFRRLESGSGALYSRRAGGCDVQVHPGAPLGAGHAGEWIYGQHRGATSGLEPSGLVRCLVLPATRTSPTIKNFFPLPRHPMCGGATSVRFSDSRAPAAALGAEEVSISNWWEKTQR
jgi:hypothetical protein